MNRTDLTLLKDDDQRANPLRISVTDSARELLALEALVRQAIPMLERPEDYCTGKRLQVTRELKAALRCQDDPGGSDLPAPPSDADAPAEEQYIDGYWLEEEQE